MLNFMRKVRPLVCSTSARNHADIYAEERGIK